MPAANDIALKVARRQRHQGGATVVEFAVIVLVFLAFLFSVIEMARLMFLFNTLQEVTRRAASAAAVSDLGNAKVMSDLRLQAIFRTSAGGLILMKELTDEAIRIDYLSVTNDGDGSHATHVISDSSLPSSPTENRKNCAAAPYGENCVRLVRARVCDPQNTSACRPMKFRPLTSIFSFEIDLPIAETFARTQSFGATPN